MIDTSYGVSAVLQKYNVPSQQTSAETLVAQRANSISNIADRVTISPDAFRVETDIEDYLPKARDLKKKNFKSVKEYAEYLLMLYAKVGDLKPKPGEIHVKIEKQQEFREAMDELNELQFSEIR